MKINYIGALHVLFCFFVGGCAIFDQRYDEFRKMAAQASLQEESIQTDVYSITAYHFFKDNVRPLRIYIEGDGFSYRSRSRPSRDPTPRNPVAFHLMIVDEYTNKAYLARPCQYSKKDLKEVCKIEDWTLGRFSPKIIEAMNQAVSALKRQSGAKEIELVGFSGGGAVALLVASLRDDVIFVRTVAGNLDHQAFTQHHGVNPLNLSLNPVDVVNATAHIPQIHFTGLQDRIIPDYIAKNYRLLAADPRLIKVCDVSGATHTSGWIEKWKEMLEIKPYDAQHIENVCVM